VALIAPALLLASGWRAHDRSRYRIGEDYSTEVLAELPPGAHLIAEDDNILFELMYLHLAQGVRPDVDLVLEGVGGVKLRRCASIRRRTALLHAPPELGHPVAADRPDRARLQDAARGRAGPPPWSCGRRGSTAREDPLVPRTTSPATSSVSSITCSG
jgi:hypothetical protein